MQAPPEKLGAFYLGAGYDLQAKQLQDAAVVYDARDLTTHAVCIGMTGSGKTGLCIGLLEEAALDKVPALLIDPKGDITNLLLQFPELLPEEFQPWVNEDDARRKGMAVEEFAKATAEQWKQGLGEWGIDGARIRALQAATDFTIFTPGSDAGVPISILGSLAAPKMEFDSNAEEIRETIAGTVAALLGLVDANADPVRSREGVLLANLIEHYWRQGQDLDLGSLIMAIQQPPMRQLGVFDVDTFYPPKERVQLAMAFNSLMAAPSFQNWLKGEPLDVDRLFFTADGKQPRHSIIYIAHLSDSERMFIVTLLLENLIAWMRRQSGTTSLRALLYFDEIFGYFPPTAEPPAKRPLLTLMKQARAFGLGVVLVTQNPVDLDYKGLANAGTWFIGKLQTERDKARVLEGLEGALAEAGAGASKVDYSAVIGQLDNRVFLLHNVHGDGPRVFHTRWAMSYLRGPLTRPQVHQLMADAGKLAAPTPAAPANAAPVAANAVPTAVLVSSVGAPGVTGGQPPPLDPEVQQVYLPIEVPDNQAIRQLAAPAASSAEIKSIQLAYEPAIIAATMVRYVDRKRAIDHAVPQLLIAGVPESAAGVDWAQAEKLSLPLGALLRAPEKVAENQGPLFAPPPDRLDSGQKVKRIQSDLVDWLYYNARQTLLTHPALKVTQAPGEDERAFKIRLQQAARETRDKEVDALEERYQAQIKRVQDRLEKEQRDLANKQSDYSAKQQQEMMGVGETVLNFFFGRRRSVSLSPAARRRQSTMQAGTAVEAAEQDVVELQKEMAGLEQQLKEATDAITQKWAGALDALSTEEIAPRRADIEVSLLGIAWLPSWQINSIRDGAEYIDTVAAYRLPES